ncbi:MAG: hypothetical protein HY349_05435 [Nitrospirae bacterium]|nr:hypothetical protein [Nitrospirota bacterium]
MPKFITVKKAEQEQSQAVRYLKNSLVYSSALIGLISLILGYGGVIYLFFKNRPITALLTDSLVLLSAGLALGISQAAYQHYLFKSHPEYFADRMRRTELRLSGQVKKMKKVGDPTRVEHAGRWAVPYLYFLGWVVFAALIVFYTPKLNILSAVFLLLAGFHNARFFYLKRLIKK